MGIPLSKSCFPILFGNPRSWIYNTYKFSHRIRDENGYFTRKELIERYMQDIVINVDCVGKTPEQTLSRALQQLRDLGLIEFVGRGIYRFSCIDRYIKLCSNYGSQGEILVATVLDNLGIDYTREKRFGDMKHKSYLRLDFFFLINEKKFAIEFDGKQHFIPIKVWGGEDSFEKTKIRDKLKDEFCRNNSIKLLRLKSLNLKTIEKEIRIFISNN